jgi:hypothetical protein
MLFLFQSLQRHDSFVAKDLPQITFGTNPFLYSCIKNDMIVAVFDEGVLQHDGIRT